MLMAKSFKKKTETPVPLVPDSAKDLLDFLEEERGAENFDNTKEQNVKSVTGVISETDNQEAFPAYVRNTFIVREDYLDQLRDVVHTRRKAGNYLYSQKDALEEALQLFLAQTAIEARPAELKQRELQRNAKIRRGKQG
jgi:hypothetical protein